MHRIDGDNVAVALPAPQAVGGTVGYFVGEDAPPWTQVTGDWLNAVQEEIGKAIENSGIALDKTDREQLYAAMTAALVGGAVSVGAATTLHKVGVLLSADCGAFGDYSMVGLSDNTDVETDHSGAFGCDDSLITEPASETAPHHVVMLASKFCGPHLGFDSAAARQYIVCGGYDGSTLALPTWRIESVGGVMRSTSHQTTGMDYAEYFENGDDCAHPKGRLLTRRGKLAHLAQRGDRILGPVSAAPGVVGGDDELGWSGRYLRDEWGAVIADRNADGLLVPRKNPAFDPQRKLVPRSARPDEWTCVALLGQVRVAVDASVRAGDRIVAGDDGIGTRRSFWDRIAFWRSKGRPIQCMAVEVPFDKTKGYAVALCLVG